MLPAKINVDHEVIHNTSAGNNIREAWERMTMAMSPDSHYMWLYVSVVSYGTNATIQLEHELAKLALENGDNITFKDFQINDNHRCYTFNIDYETGSNKAMLKVKETVDTVQRLLTKHNCIEVEELIALRDRLEAELNLINNREGEIDKAKQRLQKEEGLLLKSGAALSKSRKKNAKEFSRKIEEIIQSM